MQPELFLQILVIGEDHIENQHEQYYKGCGYAKDVLELEEENRLVQLGTSESKYQPPEVVKNLPPHVTRSHQLRHNME